MKLSVQSMNNGLFHMAKNRFMREMQYGSRIPCEADVFVTNAFIDKSSWRDQNRPYLALQGEVRNIRGEFPCSVSEVSFDESSNRPHVEYAYELTNDELATLCKAGLYDPGFSCPDIFFSNTFQLPLTCDCAALPPEQEEDVPLLFVSVNEPTNLKTSSLQSGYDIGQYCPQASQVTATKELTEDYESWDDYEDEPVVREPASDLEVSDEAFALPEDEPELEEPVQELDDEDRLVRDALANIEARKTAHAERVQPEPVAVPRVQEPEVALDDEDLEDDFDDDFDDDDLGDFGL